jgi:hypothetical protein
LRTGRLVYSSEWLQSRACYTAQVVAALHDCRHFDALLVAGPRRSVRMLRQVWSAGLRSCPASSLEVTVTAGESAILAAALAKTPGLARRLTRASHAREHIGISAPLASLPRPFSRPPALPARRLPAPALAVAAAAARTSHMEMVRA